MTSKKFLNGTSVTYAYTLASQLSAVTDSRGVTSYTYDPRDRLLTCNEPDGARLGPHQFHPIRSERYSGSIRRHQGQS